MHGVTRGLRLDAVAAEVLGVLGEAVAVVPLVARARRAIPGRVVVACLLAAVSVLPVSDATAVFVARFGSSASVYAVELVALLVVPAAVARAATSIGSGARRLAR